MYSQVVLKQFERFANADMCMARKEGEIIIARTKEGNVNLKYWPVEKKYSITKYTGEVLYEGKAKGCRETIANLYDVVQNGKEKKHGYYPTH